MEDMCADVAMLEKPSLEVVYEGSLIAATGG